MKHRRGYTLIEMMIVVTLIAIVTATAMPHIDYQAGRQDAAVRAIRGALQQAQSYAVSSQHNVFVLPDMNGLNKIYIVYDYNDNLTLDATEHYIAVPLQDGVKIMQPPTSLPGDPSAPGGLSVPVASPPVTLSASALTASSKGWVFRADGAVSTGGQLYIGSVRGLNKDFRAIDITQATGHVDWYKYTPSNTWVTGGF